MGSMETASKVLDEGLGRSMSARKRRTWSCMEVEAAGWIL